MDKEEFDKKFMEYKQGISDFKKTGRISECFHPEKAKCKGAIKQSHSIQRNGRLSIIEGLVNGNQVIYTFTEAEIDEHTAYKTLKPIGKALASTFFGFCDYHDTALFSKIENHPFDDSDEHCFLHSYRSFAHSYHRKKEELKSHKIKSKYTEKLPAWYLEQSIQELEIGVKEGEEIKQKLDNLLISNRYDELVYITYILPEKYPIACSSIISPYFTYHGKPLNNHNNPDKPFSYIMLTILPDTDQTIIIIACLPDDKDAVNFIDELNALPNYKLEKAISSIIINCAENTFFAPALWEALGINGQRILCDELHRSALPFHVPEGFEHSKINFFDLKYSAKKLKI